MLRITAYILPFALLVGVTSAGPVLAQEANDPPVACGSIAPPSDALDYRQRDATNFNRWRLKDNNQNHLAPPIARMREGEYSRRVRADIEFLLLAWPNHYPGLEALVRYDLAGGSAYDLQLTECLFARARYFAPNDINVLLIQAYYHWKSGSKDLALHSYQLALAIDRQSTDANYLIGLLYFEVGQYADADRHAQIAYGQGYPLPGLKNKLEKAGWWAKSAERSVEIQGE